MDISKQEAQGALDDIARISAKTQRALSNGPSPAILMLWGGVWALGNAATHFAPTKVGLIWTVVGTLGFIGTSLLKARFAKQVTKTDGTADPNMSKIGWFWAILFGYAILWAWILYPGRDHNFTSGSQHLSAFLATIPMFAYTVGGLWFGRFWLWLGLAVTAITIIGLCFVPDYFWLWMAAFGGGALFLSGMYMKKS